MRRFLSRHAPKIGLGNALLILVMLACGTVLLGRHTSIISLLASSATTSEDSRAATLYFTPYNDGSLLVGETTDVDVSINARTPINAVGTTIMFPPDMIEIVGISKVKSFLDLWTEDTVISETEGRIHFSGGTTESGGMRRVGTLVTLTIRAKSAGIAELYFLDPLILAANGMGTEIKSDLRTLEYTISVPPQTIAQTPIQEAIPYERPNLDFNTDGNVSIADASILIFKLIGTYDARYDLDRNGSLGLSDLSVFFSPQREVPIKRSR